MGEGNIFSLWISSHPGGGEGRGLPTFQLTRKGGGGDSYHPADKGGLPTFLLMGEGVPAFQLTGGYLLSS